MHHSYYAYPSNTAFLNFDNFKKSQLKLPAFLSQQLLELSRLRNTALRVKTEATQFSPKEPAIPKTEQIIKPGLTFRNYTQDTNSKLF